MDACVRCSWHETGNVGVEHAAPDALRCAQRLHTLCLTLICSLLKLCLSIMPMEQCCCSRLSVQTAGDLGVKRHYPVATTLQRLPKTKPAQHANYGWLCALYAVPLCRAALCNLHEDVP